MRKSAAKFKEYPADIFSAEDLDLIQGSRRLLAEEFDSSSEYMQRVAGALRLEAEYDSDLYCQYISEKKESLDSLSRIANYQFLPQFIKNLIAIRQFVLMSAISGEELRFYSKLPFSEKDSIHRDFYSMVVRTHGYGKNVFDSCISNRAGAQTKFRWV